MTELGIIADVHGNLEALRAVLAALAARRVARIVCLGDLVGYNADPDACVAALAARGAECIAGNHDLIALYRLGFERCTPGAAFALRRTRRALAEPTRRFLAGLPAPARAIAGFDGELVAIHGGVVDVCEYLRTPARVAANAAELARRDPAARVCWFGHTHTPAVYEVDRGGDRCVAVARAPGPAHALDGDHARIYFVNPGSVDAARKPTGERRAEFAIFDPERRVVRFHAVAYDDRTAEGRARARGYRLGDASSWRARAASLVRRATRRA